jgi:hypothetical protein
MGQSVIPFGPSPPLFHHAGALVLKIDNRTIMVWATSPCLTSTTVNSDYFQCSYPISPNFALEIMGEFVISRFWGILAERVGKYCSKNSPWIQVPANGGRPPGPKKSNLTLAGCWNSLAMAIFIPLPALEDFPQ